MSTTDGFAQRVIIKQYSTVLALGLLAIGLGGIAYRIIDTLRMMTAGDHRGFLEIISTFEGLTGFNEARAVVLTAAPLIAIPLAAVVYLLGRGNRFTAAHRAFLDYVDRGHLADAEPIGMGAQPGGGYAGLPIGLTTHPDVSLHDYEAALSRIRAAVGALTAARRHQIRRALQAEGMPDKIVPAIFFGADLPRELWLVVLRRNTSAAVIIPAAVPGTGRPQLLWVRS